MSTVVVGAGLAGLMAGRALVEAGHEVVLLDKGRSPGGRLATRRIGPATLDHGAQFFTVRSPSVRRARRALGIDRSGPRVVPRLRRGRRASPLRRHRRDERAGQAPGRRARRALLDAGLRHPRPARTDRAWSVGLDDGTAIAADAIDPDLPAAAVVLAADHRRGRAARRTCAAPTTTARSPCSRVLDRPSAVPAPGGVQDADETFSFIGDNEAKGVSAVPAVTFHARPDWSLERWDRPPDEVARRADRAGPPVAGRRGRRRVPAQAVAVRHPRSRSGQTRAGGRRTRPGPSFSPGTPSPVHASRAQRCPASPRPRRSRGAREIQRPPDRARGPRRPSGPRRARSSASW